MKEPAKDAMNDLGAPRRTGFYAGAFESAQRSGTPLLAIAFRRTENSIVEIFKLDHDEDGAAVASMLIKEGVRCEDIWPVSIAVGKIETVSVKVSIPVAK